jgi:hypothetical protein
MSSYRSKTQKEISANLESSRTDSNHLSYEVKNRVEKFEQYFNDPEQFNKIFTELGFTYVKDGCDGFCPECEQMLKCEVYKEIKDEWEWIYS